MLYVEGNCKRVVKANESSDMPEMCVNKRRQIKSGLPR